MGKSLKSSMRCAQYARPPFPAPPRLQSVGHVPHAAPVAVGVREHRHLVPALHEPLRQGVHVKLHAPRVREKKIRHHQHAVGGRGGVRSPPAVAAPLLPVPPPTPPVGRTPGYRTTAAVAAAALGTGGEGGGASAPMASTPAAAAAAARGGPHTPPPTCTVIPRV